MPEIDLPDPDESEERASNPFTRRVALFVAVYAVALAISSLGGSNAAEDMLMAQQRASNQWNYYQARVSRENLYLLEAEKFDLELEARGAALAETERRRLEYLRDKYRRKVEEYKTEKDVILAEFHKEETARDEAQRRDTYFDLGDIGLQIAIVLASVAMLADKRWAFIASLIVAAVGVLLAANGLALFVEMPGLE